jgi:hypothetical protein
MVGFTAWDAVRRVSARTGALVVLGVLLTGGCAGKSNDGSESDPCPDVCARGSKCPGAPPLPASCDDTCLGQDALALDSGCHDLYVASIRCSAKLADICTALTACRTEINAVNACEYNYCTAHRSADVCVNVM